MSTPLDEYLLEKQGAGFGKHLSGAVGAGIGTALGAAAVAGVGMAASHIIDAVTKARDFKGMLGSPFNQDLHQAYRERPREFNAAYSSLRSMNPEFSKDPMVAGTYMRRMMTFDPSNAGGVLVEALGHRDRIPVSPMHEAFHRGGVQGAATGYGESLREQSQRERDRREQLAKVELAELGHAFKTQQDEASHGRSMKLKGFEQYLRDNPGQSAVSVMPRNPATAPFR